MPKENCFLVLTQIFGFRLQRERELQEIVGDPEYVHGPPNTGADPRAPEAATPLA